MNDDVLLERLRDALQPSDVTPPPHRVAEVRRRAEEGGGAPTTRPHDTRRWLAMAAACLVAFVIGIAAGNLLGGSDRPPAATAATETEQQIYRLAAALSAPQPDLAAVRDADDRMEAALALLSPEDRERLQPLASRLHHEAQQVLAAEPTTTSPPTTEATSPAVEITAVTPNSDGSYRVDFRVEGFSPDPEGYQVAFNFDDGVLGPFPYAGASPWGFGADVAKEHDKVCVEVVGPQLVPVPGTSVCVPIP